MSLLTDSLVSYWRLNEVSAGSSAMTRNDAHGLNALVDTNTVASATGKVGLCANFAAANSEMLTITDANQTGLDPGTSDFTILFYLNLPAFPGAAAYFTTIIKGATADGTPGYYLRVYDTGQLRCLLGNGTSRITINSAVGAIAATGTWYQVALLLDRDGTASWVVNAAVSGTPTDISSFNGANIDTTAALQIGGVAGAYLSGMMDSVGIWSRLLSLAELAQIDALAAAGIGYPWYPPGYIVRG